MKTIVLVGLLLFLVGTAEAKSAKIVATVSKFNQVADIPPTLIYAPRRAGFYRVAASSTCGQVQIQAIPGPSRLRVESPGYVRVGDGIFYVFDSLGQGPCNIGIAVEDVFDLASVPPPPVTTTTVSTTTTTTMVVVRWNTSGQVGWTPRDAVVRVGGSVRWEGFSAVPAGGDGTPTGDMVVGCPNPVIPVGQVCDHVFPVIGVFPYTEYGCGGGCQTGTITVVP